jgi:uncharacterized protein YecE (DUF72 family)
MEPKDNTGSLRIGTSGWSYPPASGPGTWTGVFYPLSRTDELKFYSRFFNAVEVNSTFYRPCVPKTAESWVKRTPDDFEFTVKLWQIFTHAKEGFSQDDVRQFKEGLSPLADGKKLGCLLIQFPASFKATDESIDRLRRLLDEFHAFDKAVELRHESWDDSREMLADYGAMPVFIDEPKFRTSIRQDLADSGDLLYLRLHGRQFSKWWKHEHRNERYDYLYTAEEIQPYAERLKKKMEKGLKRAYTFFNNHPGAKAVANAVMMRDAMEIPVQAELPERFIERFPELKRDSRGCPPRTGTPAAVPPR